MSKGKKRRRSSAKQNAIWHRREKVMQYRVQGLSHRQIASLMKGRDGVPARYSHVGVMRDLDAVRDEMLDGFARQVDSWRVESHRLMELLMAQLSQMLNGSDSRQELQVMDRIIKVDAKIRKLHGLDRSTKAAHTDAQGTDIRPKPPVFILQRVTPEGLKDADRSQTVQPQSLPDGTQSSGMRCDGSAMRACDRQDRQAHLQRDMGKAKKRRRSSARQDAIWSRREKVMQYRALGLNHRQIATKMKGCDNVSLRYSHIGVMRDLAAVRNEVLDRFARNYDSLRVESHRRMEILKVRLSQMLNNSDSRQKLQVMDRILKVDAELHKLHGLDRPVKMANTNTHDNDMRPEPPIFILQRVTPEDLKRTHEEIPGKESA